MEYKAVIEELVERCFLNGAVNDMNTQEMRKGFHPDFALLIPKGEELFKLPLDTWVNVIEQYKASPEKMRSKLREVDYKYEVIDIVGQVAIVKVELFRDKIQIGTDFLSLLRFADGWKVVAKVSNEHVPNPFNI